jgi:hypothetical protein
VVDTIATEMAYIRVTKDGLVLEEVAPGLTAEDVPTRDRSEVDCKSKAWSDQNLNPSHVLILLSLDFSAPQTSEAGPRLGFE